ncbi:GlsB/YeaQ/YmgE family stress response membrane protein [Aurantimonas sp. C2-6-R+9]|nr:MULTISPECIES: GlsB/YeaQ/YmgE family stress response membrane protein [unclassified Aurantimonas]MEC5290285.1 GlsB/YeaQ/YmgE family stress response membrane protein [Aurantimonas sp. C2-3-R2]MEC5321652.1 GlsB/YeaQ/YmgE family stress response membrane protein [Aurantimonas sp. A3-2-R12]MEC5380395.1 GlsB/YeaQ/YmgE family stress response membrane protein [Aurantimonas sp. C2-6-R+9]MEC5411349.1 GlsB/YeaQ/YmgE family stress response membrane protein [Aurantimonas sp. C2-4-R8]
MEIRMSWLAAIIVGGIAGWLAEKVMKSDMGLFMNIILGIVGAIVLNLILGLTGLVDFQAGASFSFSYLIVGFIGACLLIFIFRAVRGRT